MGVTRGSDGGRSRRRSVWWQMISGMRAYGVAITLIWALSATSLLVVFAIVTPGIWHAALGGAAVLELVCSALTFWFLQRVNQAGRFDV